MYKITGSYIEGTAKKVVTIYNDMHLTESATAISPTLNMADNTAGSLSLTLPPGNAGYDLVEKLSSEIIVYRDGKEIWAGRILSEKKDFINQRVLECEGELSYLNDTSQPSHEYDETVKDFLIAIIAEHNSKVTDIQKFKVDATTAVGFPTERVVCTTNNESTLEVIFTNLIEVFGGHLVIEKANGERKLHYVESWPSATDQVIRFGENLLDFTRNWDMSQLITVVKPLGAIKPDSPEGLEDRYDCSVVNGNTPYVTTYLKVRTDASGNVVLDPQGNPVKDPVSNQPAIDAYGWIESVVIFDDVDLENYPGTNNEIATELLRRGRLYLTDSQFVDMVIEVSAVDLRYLNPNIESISLLDNVRCVSRAHSDGGITLDRLMTVSELSIQLDSPENSNYTLSDTIRTSSQSIGLSHQVVIAEQIESTFLDKAKANANAIMNLATKGVITTIRNEHGSQEMLIYNAQDPGLQTMYWRWNINGLAFYDKTLGNPAFETTDGLRLALTMDGSIVADYITVGEMSADRVRAGMLYSQTLIHVPQFGTVPAHDAPNVVFNLDTNAKQVNNQGPFYDAGSLTIRKGKIILGNGGQGEDWTNAGKFAADDTGRIYAEFGKIGGFTIDVNEIYNDVLQLGGTNNQGGLSVLHTVGTTQNVVGSFRSNYWAENSSKRGLTMDIEPYASYIGIFAKSVNSASSYTAKLLWCNEQLAKTGTPGYFRANRLHLGCDLDLNNWDIYIRDDNTSSPGGSAGFVHKGYTGNIMVVTSGSSVRTIRFEKGLCYEIGS